MLAAVGEPIRVVVATRFGVSRPAVEGALAIAQERRDDAQAAAQPGGARTIDAPWAAIGQSLDQFQPTEYANYLRDCGYAHSAR